MKTVVLISTNKRSTGPGHLVAHVQKGERTACGLSVGAPVSDYVEPSPELRAAAAQAVGCVHTACAAARREASA